MKNNLNITSVARYLRQRNLRQITGFGSHARLFLVCGVGLAAIGQVVDSASALSLGIGITILTLLTGEETRAQLVVVSGLMFGIGLAPQHSLYLVVAALGLMVIVRFAAHLRTRR